MARKPHRRLWTNLSERTRKDYLRRGKSQGLTDQQVQSLYESGANVSALRGHRQRPGVSERQWTNLRRAAKSAKLDQDVEHHDMNMVLESLLVKGFTYQWILSRLEEKGESRREFRSWLKRRIRQEFPERDEGYDPGRRRYHNRNQMADIELYYYH